MQEKYNFSRQNIIYPPRENNFPLVCECKGTKKNHSAMHQCVHLIGHTVQKGGRSVQKGNPSSKSANVYIKNLNKNLRKPLSIA